MKYPKKAFWLVVMFTDLEGERYRQTLQFEANGDDWQPVDVNETTTFDVNAFKDDDGNLRVHVWQLDPNEKQRKRWTMNGATQLDSSKNVEFNLV